MDAALLQQLLTKPTPQKQQEVEIILPKEEGVVDIQTKIVDKTDLGYDGAALRQKLQHFERVHRETNVEEEEEEIVTVVPPPPSKPSLPDSPKKTAKKAPKTPKAPKAPKASKSISIMVQTEDVGSPPDLSLVVDKRGRTLGDRLPRESKKVLIQAPFYFLSNQKKFIEFITKTFLPYRRELLAEEKNISCDQRSGAFSLLTHQKLVRDYLNVSTPYRGLLLYHGLGSGKTCSSIAIAEGLKSTRPIIIMTPASLRTNYIQELKKCGDILYKINQFWEFIPTEGNEALAKALSKALQLSLKYVTDKGGAWLINVKRKPNYEKLKASHRESVDDQVNLMINKKYFFINYNGLRNSHLAELKQKLRQPNLFDHSVVIIDEVHNFVSRIVNKLKKKKSLSGQLYKYLRKAQNCRIICLTGTPIINYPNELGILFNILRGSITTYTLPLTINTQQKINEARMKEILKPALNLDYMRYQASLKQLVITRNPFGFINKRGTQTQGIKIKGGDEGRITDKEFIRTVIDALSKNNITVNAKQIKSQDHNALPDTLEEFTKWFINSKTGVLKNQNIFKKRILGLTSHFRSPQEQLMAQFNKETDLHVVEIPMSDYQLNIYESAREGERKMAMEQAKRKGRKKKKAGKGEDIYEDSVSTYRIFSRAFCNFVFPGEIGRPLPQDDLDVAAAAQIPLDEYALDNATAEEKIQNIDGQYGLDDIKALQESMDKNRDNNYEHRIKAALSQLEQQNDTYLTKASLANLSPKFLTILNNIEANSGLHLVYSQFRTLEGIGIFKLVLEANGFAQFKIIKNKGGKWNIVQREEDAGKPKFILYTGTESTEEKEIVRNIFNSQWGGIPKTIKDQLNKISPNNYHGEIAKVFMITAAGAEGISLRNVRYVHIMEPYWHPVRIEQVIGRARRICSHNDLPAEERKIEVFLYLMRFTEHQIAELISSELKIKDISKLDSKTPITSDQALYEISSIKERINSQLLKAVKEASIDCAVQMRTGGEDLTCFAFARSKGGEFAYMPTMTGGDDDDIGQANKRKKKVKVRKITYGGKKYMVNMETNEVYDYESYQITKGQTEAVPVTVGTIVTVSTAKGKKKIIKFY
jgi:hypothetical protein